MYNDTIRQNSLPYHVSQYFAAIKFTANRNNNRDDIVNIVVNNIDNSRQCRLYTENLPK